MAIFVISAKKQNNVNKNDQFIDNVGSVKVATLLFLQYKILSKYLCRCSLLVNLSLAGSVVRLTNIVTKINE